LNPPYSQAAEQNEAQGKEVLITGCFSGIGLAIARKMAGAGANIVINGFGAAADIEKERAAIETATAAASAEFHGLFLVADLVTRVQRVSARTGDASDADAEVARKQEEFVTGPVTWSRVDAAGSPAQTLANARAAVT